MAVCLLSWDLINGSSLLAVRSPEGRDLHVGSPTNNPNALSLLRCHLGPSPPPGPPS